MIQFVHLIWSVKCCWIALTRLLNFKWPQQQHHGTNTPKWHKASVIIWILFHWSTTKNYCTVRKHISSHSICVCVRVSHTVCVFQLASMPGFISMWLTCLLHASLYMQSRIYFPNGIRLWPRFDPPFLGHDTRSTVQEERVTCSVCAHDCKTQRMHWRACPHKCVPPFACSWELQQKEWGGFRTWSALLPMGWGDKCVCVWESLCVCTSLTTNVHCTERASPMITGIHSTQKHWPYRTSCNCNQPLTKLQAKTDRHSKWCDDDERRCKADRE